MKTVLIHSFHFLPLCINFSVAVCLHSKVYEAFSQTCSFNINNHVFLTLLFTALIELQNNLEFLYSYCAMVSSSSHLFSLSLPFSPVSAVPREHISPGKPASRDIRSAGSCCGCRWRLQWQGHIWLHAQRLHCACFQYPPRHWWWNTLVCKHTKIIYHDW